MYTFSLAQASYAWEIEEESLVRIFGFLPLKGQKNKDADNATAAFYPRRRTPGLGKRRSWKQKP